MATGLAWTPVGGDVLYVEATAFPGDGKLQITGQLGDVMKESAAAALSYMQDLGGRLNGDIPEDWFRSTTSTCTCPRARSRRTGPAPGITMATALASRSRDGPCAPTPR